jgi:polyhydroxyalkanoate synthesis regulator phasin
MGAEKVESQTEKQQEEPRSNCLSAAKEAVEQVRDIYEQTINRHCPGLLEAERKRRILSYYDERPYEPDQFVKELYRELADFILTAYKMVEELCEKGTITPEEAKRSVLKALKDYFVGRANDWKEKLSKTEYKLERERDMYSTLYSIHKETAMQLCRMLREPCCD